MALLIFVTSTSLAASFDCSRAVRPIDKQICASERLSSLDSTLGAAYGIALEVHPSPEEIKKDQRGWLKERDTCTTGLCIEALYEKRIRDLEKVTSELRLPNPVKISPSIAPVSPTVRVAPAPAPAPARVIPETLAMGSAPGGKPYITPQVITSRATGRLNLMMDLINQLEDHPQTACSEGIGGPQGTRAIFAQGLRIADTNLTAANQKFAEAERRLNAKINIGCLVSR